MRLIPSRFLGEITSPAQYFQSLQTQPQDHPQNTKAFDSDIAIVLSSLLCAIIVVLGLFAAARCTSLRRFSAGNIHLPPPPPANSGLDKKILETFQKITFAPKIEEKFSECAICLSDLEEGEVVRVMPQCSHGFHIKCIDTWLQSHLSCPSCRRVLAGAPCDKSNCHSS